jgi:hypothetical protein
VTATLPRRINETGLALRTGSCAAKITLVKARALLAIAAVIGSVIAMPATGPLAAATSHWWVQTFAFANRKLGVVVEGSGVEQAGRCALSLYATSNGGVTWGPPIVLSHNASCSFAGSTGETAITAGGSWFLAMPQGLFKGRVHHPGFELVSAGRLTPSELSGTVCSVAATARLVWVVLAKSCGLGSAAVLLVSGNDGGTWTRSAAMPLGSVVEVTFPDGGPDSLAVASPASAWLIGWRTTPPNADGPAEPLAVARTTDAGFAWHVTTLPCKGFLGGMLTAAGNDLAAVCLGEAGTGYEAMEVVTSTNGGASWTQRCNNGPPGLLRIVGACPNGGYPSTIVAMPDGALVMALGYAGVVEVSFDGGRIWKLALRSASSFLILARGSGAVWMLGVGPASSGLRLAESADGRRWHEVGLPSSS